MMAGMEFGLLGTLLVRRNETIIEIKQGKLRVALAALLFDANRVVTTESLIDALWPDNPPPSAQETTTTYVHRLRDALGDGGHSLITTCPVGYLIRVDDSELDVSRFKAHVGATQAAVRRGAWEDVRESADAALALWRGEPLTDVDSKLLRDRERPHLAELRMQALEARLDADLHLGFHARAAAELRKLTAAHPGREQLHARLMLALYLSDRRNDALAAYQHAWRVLDEQFGTKPGAALAELNQRILDGDPDLAAQFPAQPGKPRQESPRGPRGRHEHTSPDEHSPPSYSAAGRRLLRNPTRIAAALMSIGIVALAITLLTRPAPARSTPRSAPSPSSPPRPAWAYSGPEFCVPSVEPSPCLNASRGNAIPGTALQLWINSTTGNANNTFWAIPIKLATNSWPFKDHSLNQPFFSVIELEAAPGGQLSSECLSTLGATKEHGVNGDYYYPLTLQHCDQSSDTNATWLTWYRQGRHGHLMTMVALTNETGQPQELTCVDSKYVVGDCASANGPQLAVAANGIEFAHFGPAH